LTEGYYIEFNFLSCFKDFLMPFDLQFDAIFQMKQLRGLVTRQGAFTCGSVAAIYLCQYWLQ